MEALHAEAIEMDAQRTKIKGHEANYEAALPILAEWFPGVEWSWYAMGDYSFDTILVDASESWPPSFMLRVERGLKDAPADIEVGEYRPDTSMPGYSYFSGAAVKSAADIGRYLDQRS